MENRNNQDSAEKDRKSRVLLYFIIGVLAALNAGLVYMWRKGDKEKTEVKTQLVSEQKENLEKEQLLADARVLLEQYHQDSIELARKNVEIGAELRVKKEEVLRLVAKMNQTKNVSDAEIRALRQQVQDMKDQIAKLESQNTELREINRNLETQRERLQGDLSTANDRSQRLQGEVTRLKDIAERLQANALSITALKKKFMSEKEATTDKASAADVFRLFFKVAQNSEAKEGPRTIYIKITGPEGVTLANPGNESGKAELNGKESLYTFSTQIVYEGSEKEISSRWKPHNGFKKGTYTVEVFSEGYTMGSSKITLN
jgi:chromosome segregation ATPase